MSIPNAFELPDIKYSIIIPTFNAMGYIQSCVDSLTRQPRDDFEIIISDDFSTDGTYEYLKPLKDSRVSVSRPLSPASMTENWEWASGKASGEWQIFLGQDDALHEYFFDLADRLILFAKKHGLRSIASQRSYYFWPESRHLYRNHIYDFNATNRLEVLNMRYQSILALSGVSSYFNLPQMYTCSLFHRSLLDEARQLQDGKLFTSHPQDSNLAAIACRLEKQFVFSGIPLGWVGTSKQSAGHAISSNSHVQDVAVLELRRVYLEKIKSSGILYDTRAGDFNIDNLQLYFWQSLLNSRTLNGNHRKDFYHSVIIKYLVLGSVLNSYRNFPGGPDSKRARGEMIKRLLAANNSGLRLPNLFARLIPLISSLDLSLKILRKASRVMRSKKLDQKFFSNEVHEHYPSLTCSEASKSVADRIYKLGWLK